MCVHMKIIVAHKTTHEPKQSRRVCVEIIVVVEAVFLEVTVSHYKSFLWQLLLLFLLLFKETSYLMFGVMMRGYDGNDVMSGPGCSLGFGNRGQMFGIFWQ